MVLYYGLFALETANNTVAAITSSSSQRGSTSKKPKTSEKMSSSSNSWIYTEDLKKRYIDYHYIFVPVYIDGKTSGYNYSSTVLNPDGNNSWMYSRAIRDHLFNSTSKISSSVCYITNQGFMRDEIPRKKPLYQRYSSAIKKSTTTLTKHRSNDVVEEEDEESAENENHSIPLIKHHSVIPSDTTTDKSTVVNTKINHNLTNSKHGNTPHNTLTRIRSFFFKSSSSLSGTQS